MPYTMDTLPDAVKKMAKEAQDAWMKAFNAAYKEYSGDEVKANATAWATIKKMGYHKNKDDEWVKMEGERYKKDLLLAGKYPHPQNPEQIIEMTEEKLNEIAKYTTDFINAGGEVRAVVSHPKTEEDKIKGKRGILEKIWVENARLYGLLFLDSESDEWIKDGKLNAVSPGVYHQVVTSAGVFPVLVDHVALTASPHNLGQYPFMPLNAESFSSAEIYFENKCIAFDNIGVGDVNRGIADISKTLNQQGGWTMDGLQKILKILDMLKNELLQLFVKKLPSGDVVVTTPPGGDGDGNGGGGGLIPTQPISPTMPNVIVKGIGTSPGGGVLKTESEAVNQLLLERDTLQKRVDAFEAMAKKTIEDKKRNDRDKFESELDTLVKTGKVKPENRKGLVEEYETLASIEKINFEGKEISIADYILGRYHAVDSMFKNSLDHAGVSQVRFENRLIPRNTEEGENAFIVMSEKRAKELAKADPNCKDWHMKYEQAREEITEEFVIG